MNGKRGTRIRCLWGVWVALALAAASSCTSSEKAAPSLGDADLRSIVILSSEGLPWQLTLQSDTSTTNSRAAETFMDAKKQLERYDAWGRTGGHTATFSTLGQGVAAVQTNVESYRSTGGAKKALSGMRDFMSSGEALLTYLRAGYKDPSIDVIDAPKLGDDSSAYRLTVSLNGVQVDTLTIIFRRGPVLGQAAVGAAPDSTDTADVEAVASQMDDRIEKILSGQIATTRGN